MTADTARARPRDEKQSLWRWRVAAGCLALAVLCFRQSPGLVAPDTKLDLTADPGGLIVRALSLWNGNSLGQLQNQGYGYLFPIGPFHWILTQIGTPSWVVQRLWWSTVLIVAFVGFWRLSGALRIGTPGTRYLGAALFALSPRLVSEVGITSIEVWPMALAPWVLAPLVDRAPRSWAHRCFSSALAFGFIGGVNAVATGATLVLPTLWFLTRGCRWRAVRRWFQWLGLCLVAGAWWITPLLVLGKYSPPFLDWIESAAVTTSMSSSFNAVQGTSMWLNFLSGPSGPVWPAGWLYVSQPILIMVTGLVGALGLYGLARSDVPERRWLVLSAVTGLTLLSLGHAGAMASPLAPALRDLLDGVMAAARNTHKFEMVLRLPLVLGLTHALASSGSVRLLRRLPRALPAALGVLLVVAVAAPAVSSRMVRDEAYSQIPDHWRQAASWLDSNPATGSVLVVPAASFADFTWGSTKDEPFQALLHRPFAVRDAVPLGSAGATRLLDEVMRRLGAGAGSPELRLTLRSMGVRFVAVRNDLRLDVQGSDPIAVHQALADSGINLVADFGLTSHSTHETSEHTINERTVLPYPSVEIYDVGDPAGSGGAADLVPIHDIVKATAGPEDVPSLIRALGAGVVSIMGGDDAVLGAWAATLPTVLTDGRRKREIFFGAPTDNASPTLMASDPGRQDRPVLDYISDASAPQTTLYWGGVAGVTASSSAADPSASLRLNSATGPAAAADDDPSTRWVSGRYQQAPGEWLQLDFHGLTSVEGTTIQISDKDPVGAAPALVRVETDRGAMTVKLADTLKPQPLLTPAGTTQRLRITLVSTAGPRLANAFSIAELTVPGVDPDPRLVMPSAGGAVTAILMRSQEYADDGCHFVGERPLCAQRFVTPAPEAAGLHRTFSIDTSFTGRMTGTVVGRPGESLDALIQPTAAVGALASSRAVPGPAGRPGASVDSDFGTGWVAAPDDNAPALVLGLPEPRMVDRVQFVVDKNLAASTPKRVRVTFDGKASMEGRLDGDGALAFPARQVSSLRIDFLDVAPLLSVDAASGFQITLPVGASEVLVTGAQDLARVVDPEQALTLMCGHGPPIFVDQIEMPTEVVGTVRQLLRGEPLRWRTCGATAQVHLGPGTHRLDAPSNATFSPAEVVLSKGRFADALPARVQISDDTAGLAIPARTEASVVVVPHNFNVGWAAHTTEGTSLTPIRVNGWQQGYVLPSGKPVTLSETFGPEAPYRLALGIGFLMLGALGLSRLLLRRRTGAAEDSLTESTGHRWLVLPVAVLTLHAGLPAIAMLAVAALVLLVLPRRLTRLGPVLVGALVLVATGWVAATAWPTGRGAVDSVGVQALITVVVAAVVLAPLSWRRPLRIRGRSTQ